MDDYEHNGVNLEEMPQIFARNFAMEWPHLMTNTVSVPVQEEMNILECQMVKSWISVDSQFSPALHTSRT